MRSSFSTVLMPSRRFHRQRCPWRRPSGQQPDAGVVQGSVRDAQGAVIAGAAVDIQCGTTRRISSTGGDGAFRVESLPRAKCTATVASPMFETAHVDFDLSNGTASPAVRLNVRSFATEIVVTPTPGLKENTFNVPETMSVTTRGQIDARPYALVPQILREEPGILLQQTTTSQTSPIIRGFTGQSNVYLLDGVRFNTASWRSGPSQYFTWIDEGAVERYEVVRGPGSVQYGSDALGGTINVLTAPAVLPGDGARISGSVDGAIGSAEESAVGRVELQFQKGRSGLRGGLTARNVDDLRTGDALDSHSALTRFLGLVSTTDTRGCPTRDTSSRAGTSRAARRSAARRCAASTSAAISRTRAATTGSSGVTACTAADSNRRRSTSATCATSAPARSASTASRGPSR